MASVVFNEDDEYDSEEDEDAKGNKRKQQNAQAVSPAIKQKKNKLMSLVGGALVKQIYKAEDEIEERTITQENESPSHSNSLSAHDVSSSSFRNDTNNSNHASGSKKFALRLSKSLRPEGGRGRANSSNNEDSSSEYDDEDDDDDNESGSASLKDQTEEEKK